MNADTVRWMALDGVQLALDLLRHAIQFCTWLHLQSTAPYILVVLNYSLSHHDEL